MIVKDVFCNNEGYTHDGWVYHGVFVGFSRLYYVIDGEGYYEEGGECRMFKKGHLYLTPVKTEHTLFDNPQNKLLHTYVHIYTMPEIGTFTEIEVKEGTPLDDAVKLWRKYASTEDRELLTGVVQLVLSTVDRALARESAPARRAKRFLDDSEVRSFDMAELALAVGYTREHITRAFTAAYRMTPLQYANSRKMELARRKLLDGVSVSTVADTLGYSSLYSFSKAFKKYYGLSPRAYIKTLK